MESILQRYATPFVTGLFLVSLVSGVALFFHFGGAAFHGMHEWLSMVLIVPFVLHIWKNWRPMMAYMRKASFAIAMSLSLLAALGFVYASYGSSRAGGPPQMAFTRVIMGNTAAQVAPLLGLQPDALVESLKAKGFASAAPEAVLNEIAKQSGKDEFELVAALTAAKAQP